MQPRPRLTFAPAEPDRFRARFVLATKDEPDLTLRQLLAEIPALALQPVPPATLDLPVAALNLQVAEPTSDTALYLVGGLTPRTLFGGDAEPPVPPDGTQPDDPQPDSDTDTVELTDGHPVSLSERQAVLTAHAQDIKQVASYLASGLSVLVQCEKVLVEHLAQRTATLSGRPFHEVTVAKAGPGADPLAALGSNRRAELLAGLERTVTQAVPGDLVVISQFDLLGGGTDASLSMESRELTDLLYQHSDRTLLAFTDPSLVIPEVLASRFAVRVSMDVLPRKLAGPDGTQIPIGRALVTREEATLFEGFDAEALYKHIAGMNAVRLRHAMLFAKHEHAESREDEKPDFDWLLATLRMFKARTSGAFVLPKTKLGDIGGYQEVKAEVIKAARIINGAMRLPDGLPVSMRTELIPRGFIFHGPPGTGKTLFAKALATEIGGTIQVVSGPEITDMYVGESERKLRALFAEARRNAPAVLVFDEFDSIAGKRTGRDDGGSRAGNAVVAQLLTELDGFRPEAPVLIIGTTNRIDIIDEALLRPSRFREIKIGYPEEPESRKQIAKVHADHFQVECDDDRLTAIANCTDGMNGDEIRSIFRDAKANELVGDGRKPGARVLGEIIGRLRHGQQQREAAGQATTQTPTRSTTARDRNMTRMARRTRGDASTSNTPSTPTPAPVPAVDEETARITGVEEAEYSS